MKFLDTDVCNGVTRCRLSHLFFTIADYCLEIKLKA